MHLDFIAEAVNIVLVGPNGAGKSLIAQSLAHQAVIQGHSTLFANAVCVISIVDRLIHHSEILVIEGEPYRMREAKQRATRK